MRKPVPYYYKLMEDNKTKYMTITELEYFKSMEENGQASSLKYPSAYVYYRRCAIDHVIESIFLLVGLMCFISTVIVLIIGLINGWNVYLYNKAGLIFMDLWLLFTTVMSFGLAWIYRITIGFRFFVVIQDINDAYLNLKAHFIKRYFAFKRYPELKDKYADFQKELLKKEENK